MTPTSAGREHQLLTEQAQPRLYRVRLHRHDQEVLAGHWWPAVLDLTPGPAVAAAEAKLDALLQALAHLAGAKGAKVRDCRLTVEVWPTGPVLYDWAPRTWPDQR